MSESTTRGRHLWSTSRYPSMAANLLPAIARLVNIAGMNTVDRVFGVGCGTGNTALTAPRAGLSVVGVDVSPEMLPLARWNASLDRATDATWVGGDAEQLPFPEDAFDIVLSNFGQVFAPTSTQAGTEMCRRFA